MSTFSISSFRIPSFILKDIDSLQCLVWPEASWPTQIISKRLERFAPWLECGGLGLRKLEDMNQLLLTKLAWRIVTKPQALISTVPGAKYDWGRAGRHLLDWVLLSNNFKTWKWGSAGTETFIWENKLDCW